MSRPSRFRMVRRFASERTRRRKRGRFELLEPRLPLDASALVITELNFHPHAPTAAELAAFPDFDDMDDFKFIELYNPTAAPIDLAGVAFTDGVTFAFSDGDLPSLAAGQYVVVVEDRDAFLARYGNELAGVVAGEYSGRLNEDGERLTLVDAGGRTIVDFTYDTGNSWPAHADGHGRSLEAVDPAGDLNLPENWRASTELGGSPGAEGTIPIPTTAPTLAVTELMYRPRNPTADEWSLDPELTAAQFEFLELVNTGDSPADLAGVAIVGGVSFFFDDVAIGALAPGEHIVVVNDEDAFAVRYGVEAATAVAGEFDGQLSNNGERISLIDLTGRPFVEFTYSSDDGWPAHADGHGRSLEAVDPAADPAADLNLPENWRASTELGGSPGAEGVGPIPMPPPTLAMSEILFAPYDPTLEELLVDDGLSASQFEFVELVNTGSSPVDLAGIALVGGVSFFFDDVDLDTLDPGQRVVVANDASAFTARYGIASAGAIAGQFSGQLSNSGERIALINLTGQPFVDVTYSVGLPWPLHAEAAGRSIELADPAADPALPENWRADALYGGSPGTEGAGPGQPSDLVITEIMFQPYGPTGAELLADSTLTDDRFEFIELRNTGSGTIDLADMAFVDGIEFAFAGGTKAALDAGEFLLVVSDPAAFRLRYGNGLDGTLAGQFTGTLNDGGDRLLLINQASRRVIADVLYQTGLPWPPEAEGRGNSLELADPTGDLNLPESWRAGTEYGGSPGAEGIGPVPPVPLAVTEIMFAPYGPTDAELQADPTLTGASFQFLELQNTGDAPLDLTGVAFSGGIEFAFAGSDVSQLAAGEFVLVVSDPAAFRVRYGNGLDASIAGAFTGMLDDNVPLLLLGQYHRVLASFDFDANASWLERADGDGSSLERIDSLIDPAQSLAWQASPLLGGSPGQETAGVPPARVVINEVLGNSNDLAGELDRIELLNVSGDAVDLSGWRLSDNLGMSGNSFRVPEGVILGPGQYVVFDETQFNPNGDGTDGFAIRSAGGTLFLFAAEPDVAVRFEDAVEVGAAVESVSIGRIPNGTGDFFPLAEQSFGAENGTFYLSDVVISEIMYDTWQDGPGNGQPMEFIELLNRSDAPVDLTAWAIDGVDIRLPDMPPLAPGETVVLVAFDTSDGFDALLDGPFRVAYGIGQDVPLHGPFVGQLSNGGERIELLRPEPSDTPGEYDMIPVDSVKYDDKAPWPTRADGSASPLATAFSINRAMPDAFADHFHSWVGAVPTPGTYAATPVVSELDGLVLSELFYDPPGAGSEFIELFNPTDSAMDLSGAKLSLGINYTFALGTAIPAGGRLIVVPFNPDTDDVPYANFLVAHDMAGKVFTVVGPYTGRLDNSGESILLTDAEGRFVFNMEYVGGGRFPRQAAGQGASLQLRAETTVPDEPTMRYLSLSDGRSWLALEPTPGEAVVITPPAVRNDQVTVQNGLPVTIDFLANDTPGTLPIDVGSVVVTARVEHGTLEVSPIDGTAVYQPAADFAGDDEFRYTVLDLNGTSSAEATVAISVRASTLPPWQNPEHQRDVNDDGFVVPLDALVIINALNRNGSRLLPEPDAQNEPPPYYDVNGDGYVSPIDALQVINYLNTYGPGVAGTHGEGEPAIASLSAVAGQRESSVVQPAQSGTIAIATARSRAIDAVHDRYREAAWNAPWWRTRKL